MVRPLAQLCNRQRWWWWLSNAGKCKAGQRWAWVAQGKQCVQAGLGSVASCGGTWGSLGTPCAWLLVTCQAVGWWSEPRWSSWATCMCLSVVTVFSSLWSRHNIQNSTYDKNDSAQLSNLLLFSYLSSSGGTAVRSLSVCCLSVLLMLSIHRMLHEKPTWLETQMVKRAAS